MQYCESKMRLSYLFQRETGLLTLTPPLIWRKGKAEAAPDKEEGDQGDEAKSWKLTAKKRSAVAQM